MNPSIIIGTVVISLAVSTVVLAIYFWEGSGVPAPWMRHIPKYNATINSFTTLLLISAYIAIKRFRNITWHRNLMIAAALATLAFFVLYSIYHVNVPPTSYGGQGMMRLVYYLLLISHILAAMITLPLAIITFWLAFQKNFRLHRKIARWTFPVWLYAAATGVLTYLMLAPYYAS